MSFRPKTSLSFAIAINLFVLFGCSKTTVNQVGNEQSELVKKAMATHNSLLIQAERDHISVTDEEVEAQVNNRIDYFIELYGSKENLEKTSVKTIEQLKDECREALKDQMTAEKELEHLMNSTGKISLIN